jgi:hypothetical protein
MAEYILRNPHTLPMIIKLMGGGMVKASFPALSGCDGISTNPDPWKARDEAILNCARAIVDRLQTELNP